MHTLEETNKFDFLAVIWLGCSSFWWILLLIISLRILRSGRISCVWAFLMFSRFYWWWCYTTNNFAILLLLFLRFLRRSSWFSCCWAILMLFRFYCWCFLVILLLVSLIFSWFRFASCFLIIFTMGCWLGITRCSFLLFIWFLGCCRFFLIFLSSFIFLVSRIVVLLSRNFVLLCLGWFVLGISCIIWKIFVNYSLLKFILLPGRAAIYATQRTTNKKIVKLFIFFKLFQLKWALISIDEDWKVLFALHIYAPWSSWKNIRGSVNFFKNERISNENLHGYSFLVTEKLDIYLKEHIFFLVDLSIYIQDVVRFRFASLFFV